MALAQQTLRALAGVTVISDATIQASANYVAGSDQQAGTATLVAHNGYESNITLSLGDGQRTEIRNGFVQPPQGKRAGTDGVWQIMALHNCWTDPAWFFPALTLQSALNDPQVYFTYLGPAVRAGIAVIGIQISRFVPGQSANSTALIQTLAQIQIYVSPTNYVPVAMDFNLHPDSDAGVNLPVEIQYSGWHALGPVQVPSQMQKFLQGCLTLTLGGITAAVNTGVPQSAFAM